MLELSDLEFFQSLAKASSLSSAAKEFNVSVSAVSQRLSLLEKRVGLQLYERKGGKSILTENGVFLASRGKNVLLSMQNLMQQLERRSASECSTLRILAPLGIGRSVARIMTQFAQAHAGTNLQLIVDNSTPELGRQDENIDVRIYLGEPMIHTDMEQWTLGTVRRILVASPRYVSRHGLPMQPQDLAFHVCGTWLIGPPAMAPSPRGSTDIVWTLTNSEGHIYSCTLNAQFSSNDSEAVTDWAIAGMGIISRSEWSASRDIQVGKLMRILPDWGLSSHTVTALCSHESSRIDLVRSFLTLVKAELKETFTKDATENVGFSDDGFYAFEQELV